MRQPLNALLNARSVETKSRARLSTVASYANP